MIVGIDPGVSGAMAVIKDGCVEIFDLSRFVEENHRLIIEKLSASAQVFIENPNPGPNARASQGLFRMMGGVELSLSLLGCTVTYVPPQTWMTALLLKYSVTLDGKKKWRYYSHKERQEKARNLYPEAAHYLERVKDNNRADALLIAHYGRNKR